MSPVPVGAGDGPVGDGHLHGSQWTEAPCVVSSPLRRYAAHRRTGRPGYRTARSPIPNSTVTDTEQHGHRYRTARSPLPNSTVTDTEQHGHRYRTARSSIQNSMVIDTEQHGHRYRTARSSIPNSTVTDTDGIDYRVQLRQHKAVKRGGCGGGESQGAKQDAKRASRLVCLARVGWAMGARGFLREEREAGREEREAGHRVRDA